MKNIMKITAAVLALSMITTGGYAAADSAPADTALPAVSHDTDKEYVYCVGSVSKVYSTAAIMQLADEGRIDIEKPVTEYIPDFRMADERYKKITVHMLMDHTSGIMGSSRKNNMFYGETDQYHHDHLLESLATQRLRAAPGKYAAYTNDGFDLMEIIVENVSGMTYTEYIKQNISGKLGADMTGTALDMEGHENLVPSVSADNIRYETEYEMCFGTGGVYATASDNAKFGTAFFTGNDVLLSEDAKNAMATRWNDNEFSDNNGLGWDYAGMEKYEDSGVTVVAKGGDVSADHAWLWVAPDEHISVSVLSNGGSSTFNGMTGSALLDTALAEKGISISENVPGCTTVDVISDEYNKYAGWYFVDVDASDSLYNISFPGNKYMHIEKTTSRRTTCTDYLLTTDGDFAELAYEVEEEDFDKRLSPGYSRLSFEENADGIFVKKAEKKVYPGLGSYMDKTYFGQKIEENEVSDDVIDEYRALEGKMLLVHGEKYSSSGYDTARCYVIDKLKGYFFLTQNKFERIVKIDDSDHLTAFNVIPSSASRDIWDVTIERDGNGISGLHLSNGLSFITDDRADVFDATVKTVTIEDDAVWYNISDSIANTPMTVIRPEKSSVYVYNKYGEMIYTTHNLDARPQIPMPKGGKVLFLGESGSKFEITE